MQQPAAQHRAGSKLSIGAALDEFLLAPIGGNNNPMPRLIALRLQLETTPERGAP